MSFQANPANIADSKNVILGRGITLLSRIDPTTGLPDAAGFRDFGNATALALNVTTERTTRTNFRGFTAVQDLELILQQTCGLTLTGDEATGENIADFLAGSAADEGYTSTLATDITDKLITDVIFENRWYELRDANDHPLLGIVLGGATAATLTVEVDDNAGFTTPTALTLGTDYELDLNHGLIRFLSTSATDFTADRYAQFSYDNGTATAKTFDTIDPLHAGVFQGWLKFLGKNFNGTKRFQLDFFKVLLGADGDLNIIGNEVAQLSFSGSTQSNALAKAALGCQSEIGRFYAGDNF